MKTPPIASYRVQLRPEFGFAALAEVADYLASLGISHVYTSPYFQAAKGSAHGYDVVDPGRINEELGGPAGREVLCRRLEELGLRQLIDLVPNHMAIRGGHNAWWWDVLENGPASRYASYFDVEWKSEGPDCVLLPILGGQYGVELEEGRLRLAREHGAFYVEYFDHRTPVAPRSLGLILREAAARANSHELAFLGDAFELLPIPSARDDAMRAKRHRDKEVLMTLLARLVGANSEVADAIDAVINLINADPERLNEVLERQNYRLAFWKLGNHELGYRRFFDVDSLVGMRVEDDEVFEATHALVLPWLRSGSIDALRIDHVDGLSDPESYLRRLIAAAPSAWVIVEKILEGSEKLPPSWPVAGTTGYDFLNHVSRWLIDPRGVPALDALHVDVVEDAPPFEEVVTSAKHSVLQLDLASDLKRMVERLASLVESHRRYRDTSRYELTEGLREVLAAFSVYRTYIRASDEDVRDADRNVIESACQKARAARPDLEPTVFEFLQRTLLLQWRDPDAIEFVTRLQQLSGPTMAKGLEDTAFYRHARFVALNEVGGDPDWFSESTEDLHAWLGERQLASPLSLNTSSTHDTKRSEDVRARLFVLSEIPDLWRARVQSWIEHLRPYKTRMRINGMGEAPEASTEYFLLQCLVGAWPIDEQRMSEYALKAAREAKRYTSWQRPNAAYEDSLSRYVAGIFADAELLADVESFVASIHDAGLRNSLVQVVLKTLAPGVPDVYQGCELWDFSLVDPDNRRPVDYTIRRQLLAQLDDQTAELLWSSRNSGAVKLRVLERVLRLRRAYADAFGARGSYEPLDVIGQDAERVLAFARGPVVAVVSRWWQGADAPKHATLGLPAGEWRSLLADRPELSGQISADTLLGPLPVAILEKLETVPSSSAPIPTT